MCVCVRAGVFRNINEVSALVMLWKNLPFTQYQVVENLMLGQEPLYAHTRLAHSSIGSKLGGFQIFAVQLVNCACANDGMRFSCLLRQPFRKTLPHTRIDQYEPSDRTR